MTEPKHSGNTGRTALLIIDMINKFAFPEAADLIPMANAAADAALSLRAAADALDVQTIYVNDNYGEWASDRNALIEHCLDRGGSSIVHKIRPRKHDLFVIKPQFSGFYATNLPVFAAAARGKPAGADRHSNRYMRLIHGSRRSYARL